MELEVGMYVRTHKGEIKKIFQYNEQENNPLFCVLNCYVTNKGTILKASHKIIDLIEVGDYVNGYRVDYIENTNANNIFILQRIFCEEYEKDLYAKSFKHSDIKSIVTKEMFSSVEYRVETN